jgi:transposase
VEVTTVLNGPSHTGLNSMKVDADASLDQGCPDCGVVSSRIHAWVMQRVRDIGHAGRVEVVVRKPRLVCAEPACARRTFIPATDQRLCGPGAPPG